MKRLTSSLRTPLILIIAVGLIIALVVPLVGLGAPPPQARAAQPLSGTVASAGHVLTYAVGGVSTPSGALAQSSFDGVVTAGATAWFSGSATFAAGSGVTDLFQSASLSGAQSKTYDAQIGGFASHTMTFNLSAPARASFGQPDAQGVVGYMHADLSSRNCGGVCEGASLSLTFAVVAPGVLPTPTPSPGQDTTDPVVTLKANRGGVRIGDSIPMVFTVTDDSGRAAWDTAIYSDGKRAGYGYSVGFVKATGQERSGSWGYPRTETGPFFQCVWAEDAAGNRSANAPFSACRWLSVQVKVPKVSNGCGGSDWGPTALKVMNWFGDTRFYGPRDTPVDMRWACNQHDAAYAGVTIAGMRSKKLVDYRKWSRDEVDTKFGQELQSRCHRLLRGRQLSGPRRKCLRDVNKYLGLVRTFGVSVFDADVTTFGTQRVGPAYTVPPGGSRLNN